jgi:hypothetical protein
VIATAYTHEVEYIRSLRVDHVIDVQTAHFEAKVKDVDIDRYSRRRDTRPLVRGKIVSAVSA